MKKHTEILMMTMMSILTTRRAQIAYTYSGRTVAATSKQNLPL